MKPYNTKNVRPAPWVSFPRRNPQSRARLFCLPYAGGGASVFRSWPDLLPEDIEVCPVNLPGRGVRLREPPYTSMAPLAQEVARALLPYADKPFAFFGHSMGALISFEIARHLRGQYGLIMSHLFVSACVAPQLRVAIPQTHLLPDDQFTEELYRLNGTPQELLAAPEFMKVVLPALRADFSICETYNYAGEPPLDCPITAYGGSDDKHVKSEHLEAWREQTTSSFAVHLFRGGHFFLHSAGPRFFKALSEELRHLEQV
ncbi:MAG TPA: alpha/beta fold hydrolase [Blastocatellia bacterium]|nr:alpha/beta fold hydrolase [Blastocatellia bacterium]